MAAWRKLYRPGASIESAVKPAPPAGVGAYHDTFMVGGPVKNTSVRCAGNGTGEGPVRAPMAATAPGALGPPIGIGRPGPGGGVIPAVGGMAGTPGGDRPAGGGKPPAGRIADGLSPVGL